MLLLAASLLLPQPVLPAPPRTLLIDDFEEGVTWSGAAETIEHCKSGRKAAAWVDHPNNHVFRAPGEKVPKDWSHHDRLAFWMYSEVANGARLTMVLESENQEDKQGWDYYYYHFRVDWSGWKRFSLHLGNDIRPTRNPRGWDQIDGFYISCTSWQNQPLPDTALYVDDIMLERDLVSLKVGSPKTRETERDYRKTWRVTVVNGFDATRSFHVALDRSRLRAFSASLTRAATSRLAPGESDTVLLALAAQKDSGGQPLSREECTLSLDGLPPGIESPNVTVDAVVPLPPASHPCLLASKKQLRQAKRRAERLEWARPIYDKIIEAADTALPASMRP